MYVCVCACISILMTNSLITLFPFEHEEFVLHACFSFNLIINSFSPCKKPYEDIKHFKFKTIYALLTLVSVSGGFT